MKTLWKIKLNKKTIAFFAVAGFLLFYLVQKNTGPLAWLQLLDFVLIALFDAETKAGQ